MHTLLENGNPFQESTPSLSTASQYRSCVYVFNDASSFLKHIVNSDYDDAVIIYLTAEPGTSNPILSGFLKEYQKSLTFYEIPIAHAASRGCTSTCVYRSLDEPILTGD